VTCYLLDANVLIALTISEHEHHDRASAWAASIERFALCPVVEGAFVRFLVRIGESATSAAAVLRAVRALPRCEFWPDTVSYTDVRLTQVRGHRQVTDAYLATLAEINGGLLATLDEALAAELAAAVLLLPAIG
jgi:toxin-antitoxin system PIN domain toxin